HEHNAVDRRVAVAVRFERRAGVIGIPGPPIPIDSAPAGELVIEALSPSRTRGEEVQEQNYRGEANARDEASSEETCGYHDDSPLDVSGRMPVQTVTTGLNREGNRTIRAWWMRRR